MVALRSRRLQAIFGVPLDDLQYEHLEALVPNQVSEAFDLDFKGSQYGNADRDRRDLATDVAALANTAGGLLVLAVVRSPLAPHAVIVNQGLRYPRRNGTTTRYLSEPEVASAYRERLAGAQRQAARVEEIEGEA